MNDDVRRLIAKLPDPVAPAALTAIVMARIAQESDRRRTAAPARARHHNDRLAWLSGLAGLAMLLTGEIVGWVESGGLPEITSSSLGNVGLAQPPISVSATLLLVLGTLFYFVGLFTPLRDH